MAHHANDWYLSQILGEMRRLRAPSNPKTLGIVIREVQSKAAEAMLKSIKSSSRKMLSERRLYRRQFKKRLLERWKRPIDLLETLVGLCLEEGAEFNDEQRETAARTEDYVFDVLTRLHARSCQIAYEILSLLISGFADGAHARWRTLHEIVVIASFIREHGQDLAKRYLYYEAVETYKEACAYQEHCQELGYEPLSNEQLRVLKERRDEAFRIYGRDFGSSYGWVPRSFLRRRDFAEIEKHMKLDQLRPYYIMACHNVHSGPKAIEFRLGLLKSKAKGSVLLAGPSNYGLADPGQCMAISLAQTTICLLSTKPTIKRLIAMKVILRLVDEICPAFCEIQSEIEREEKYLP